jgi:hypothetical protein
MEPHRSGFGYAALIAASMARSLRQLEDSLFVRAQFFCEPEGK